MKSRERVFGSVIQRILFYFKKITSFLGDYRQITFHGFHKGNLFILLFTMFPTVQSPKTSLYSCMGISQKRRDLRKTHSKIPDNSVIRALSWEFRHVHSGSFRDSWNLYHNLFQSWMNNTKNMTSLSHCLAVGHGNLSSPDLTDIHVF